MLRLAGGEFEWEPCGRCDGRGWVPCPPTTCVRTGVQGSNNRGPILTPSTGKPIPCPECDGKKVVPKGGTC